MTQRCDTYTRLPLPLPVDPLQRLVLASVRRMAGHGIYDAQTALLTINRFGINFRRPLVLLRSFLTELAQVSQRRIVLAPCCAFRMSLDEGRIVGVLAVAATNPACAARHLGLLTGGADSSSPLSLAIAYGRTLEQVGVPLRL